jgi:predicted phage tail protein
MWNIIIGGVFVIGGLSGQLALRGTDSSMALVILGLGLILWGTIQLINRRRQ